MMDVSHIGWDVWSEDTFLGGGRATDHSEDVRATGPHKFAHTFWTTVLLFVHIGMVFGHFLS